EAYRGGTIDRRTFVKRMVGLGVSLAAAGAAVELLDAQRAEARVAGSVPNPTVVGPVPASVPPGDPAHDYPFFSTQFAIYSQGHAEGEFFLQGTANRYTVGNGQLTTATLVDGGHPYRTRMVVRRPAAPKRFNGTAVVEWYNVTVGFDVEANWFRYHEE